MREPGPKGVAKDGLNQLTPNLDAQGDEAAVEAVLAALRPVLRGVLAAAQSEPGLRTDLERLLRTVLELGGVSLSVAGPAATDEETPPPEEAHRNPARSVQGAPAREPPEPEPAGSEPASDEDVLALVSSFKAGTGPATPSLAPSGSGAEELELAEGRCRLKASAVRLAARPGGRPQGERDRLGQEMEALGIDPWVLDPWVDRADRQGLEALAGSFDATADAARLLRRLLASRERPPETQAAVDLLAWATSALRAAVSWVRGEGRDRWDEDQERLFSFLRDFTWAERVYVGRHMRLDDPADPLAWPELRMRIAALAAPLDRREGRRKRLEEGRRTVAYHAGQLRAGRSLDAERDWRRIAAAVEELLEDGLTVGDLPLRESLAPVVASAPELDYPPGFAGLLRSLGRPGPEPPPPGDAEPSWAGDPRVERLAARLRGRSLVVIGGEARAESAESLRRAFGLARVEWVEPEVHESYRNFEAAVARPEVAAVVLLTRWAGHDHQKVRKLCKKHGKPFVKLPGGYGVLTVAQHLETALERKG